MKRLERVLQEAADMRDPKMAVTVPISKFKKVNDGLYDLAHNKYYSVVPLDDVFKLLKKSGFAPIDEDGEEWSGLLTGREGKATIRLAVKEHDDLKLIKNMALHIQWYKMETGKYEFNGYVS